MAKAAEEQANQAMAIAERADSFAQAAQAAHDQARRHLEAELSASAAMATAVQAAAGQEASAQADLLEAMAAETRAQRLAHLARAELTYRFDRLRELNQPFDRQLSH